MKLAACAALALLISAGSALAQEAEARAFLAELAAQKIFPRPVVTELQPLSNYWPAEDYHQDFFEKNPYQGYCMAVAAPKVAKFRKTFAELQRP